MSCNEHIICGIIKKQKPHRIGVIILILQRDSEKLCHFQGSMANILTKVIGFECNHTRHGVKHYATNIGLNQQWQD